MVFRMLVIRCFVGILLPAHKGLGILYILRIQDCYHFRELHYQMPLQFPVYILVIHFL